jgi:hypothetical protein
LKEFADKNWIFLTYLKAQAFSYFEHHPKKKLEAEDSKLTENDLVELVIRGLYIDLEYTPWHVLCVKSI